MFIKSITWPIALVIIVGFVLAVLGYEAMEYSQHHQRNTQFQHLAQEKRFIAAAQLDDTLDSLTALRAFYLSSQHVTKAEFKLYAQHFLEHSHSLLTLLWVPVVHSNQRSVFENAHSTAQSDFQIYQWGESKRRTLVQAQHAMQYYPITYLAGITQADLPVGLDLATLPGVKAQLDAYNKHMIWIPLNTLTTTPTQSAYYLVLLPLQAMDNTVTGYIGAIIDLKALLSPIFVASPFVTYTHISLQNNPSVSYTMGGKDKPVLIYQQSFTVKKQSWDYQQILLRQPFLFSTVWPSVIIFLSLMMLTFLLALYLKNKAMQQTHTEKLVKLRTQELSHTAAQLKQQSLRLANLNAELQQFAYVAAHDLQAPLRLLQGYVQLLKDKLGNQADPLIAESIAAILVAINQMSDLINGLLAYSRAENGAIKTEKVDMNDIMNTVLTQLRDKIEKTHATITYDALPTVYGDKIQLMRLLQNLVSNGISYCQHTPTMHVASVCQRDEWIFSVKDNGIGIAEDDQQRIFELFQRLHSHDTYPGTGIGLAICKKIVERHHGHIWLESTLGIGTTFFFSLPVGEVAASGSGSKQVANSHGVA